MSDSPSPTVAIVLPPREGFGPRRATRIGLTARDHAIAVPTHKIIVFGARQSGGIFPDVTFQRVHALSFLPGSMRWRYALGLAPLLRRARPDLIEVHADAALALWLQRRFPRIPVVLIQHNDPARSADLASPEARSALLTRLARVVTVSDWLRARMLDEVFLHPNPPVVVPPAIDFARLPPSADGEDAVSMVASKRRARMILFAGRLVPEKGPEQFVSACAAALPYLPGWRAEIIGAAEHGVDSPVTAFSQLLHAIATPVSIGMMGYRDHPDVMAAMSRAAVMVIPTQTPDPSGRLALEAMANGAAVICADQGALREICGDAAVYADPTQPAALAAAIRALAQTPLSIANRSAAGRQRAKQFALMEVGRTLRGVREAVLAARTQT